MPRTLYVGNVMNAAECWRDLFMTWPKQMPKNGTLLTNHGDSIPFSDFLISGGLLLMERARPDALGNRKIMVAFADIAGLNFANNAELASFDCMGFRRSAAAKANARTLARS